MTKFGEMSVAQYREFFCGVGRDWEEEDPEDDRGVLLFYYFNIYNMSMYISSLSFFKNYTLTEFTHYSVEFINDETTTSSSQTTTTTPMTPLLADDLYNKMFSSTTPRPGSLGGGGSLLMMANVSPSAVFHSCAKIMPMRRRKRALPLIFGGLLTILIGKLNVTHFNLLSICLVGRVDKMFDCEFDFNTLESHPVPSRDEKNVQFLFFHF